MLSCLVFQDFPNIDVNGGDFSSFCLCLLNSSHHVTTCTDGTTPTVV